jgi:hypothetical protein
MRCDLCLEPTYISHICSDCAHRYELDVELGVKPVAQNIMIKEDKNKMISYEAMNVIEAWELDFNLGSVIKYIFIAHKGEQDSLKALNSAKWHLERKIKELTHE